MSLLQMVKVYCTMHRIRDSLPENLSYKILGSHDGSCGCGSVCGGGGGD
jgi:hypothetical protein